MIIDTVGSGEAVEGYGKAAVVGLDGELEHASALIHTLRFGNHYREAVGAKSYLRLLQHPRTGERTRHDPAHGQER